MAKRENSKTCRYCGSELASNVIKCRHCGEWLKLTPKHVLETLGRLVVVISFVVGIWEVRQARELQEINAVNQVMARYIEIDRLLIDKPEFASLTVSAEDYSAMVELAKTKEGIRRVQEGQFVAYALDIFETEFFLRDSYGVYPEGTEFVLDQFLTNPKVIEWWYQEGLRNWYSEDFRNYVESRMAKYPSK